MIKYGKYLSELKKCELCEHRCGVDRLAGQTGVCGMTTPVIAAASLHPAPPESYTVFTSGCNFKCLNCQNWTISQYPDNGFRQRGEISPESLAAECAHALDSRAASLMGADRIFFSGGEPSIHLPYIERVVSEARKINPEIKVNFDTNGYMTEKNLERILDFSTSVTFDLKAFREEVHFALTGASAKPVLRNAEYIGKHAKDKLWEYRIVAIPGINEEDIGLLSDFIAGIDSDLPVCFLAFRPNFVLERHPGATLSLMEKCLVTAEKSGLRNASCAGRVGLPGKTIDIDANIRKKYSLPESALAASCAALSGCVTHPRNCGVCANNKRCMLKKYRPTITT